MENEELDSILNMERTDAEMEQQYTNQDFDTFLNQLGESSVQNPSYNENERSPASSPQVEEYFRLYEQTDEGKAEKKRLEAGVKNLDTYSKEGAKEEIIKTATEGLEPGDKEDITIPGVAKGIGRGAKKLGSDLFKWMTGTSASYKGKSLSKITRKASENTLNSIISLNAEVYSFLADTAGLEKTAKFLDQGEKDVVDFVEDDSLTQGEELLAEIIPFFAGYGAGAGVAGVRGLWLGAKGIKGFSKALGAEALIGGLVDFVLADTEDENLANMLNRYKVLHKIIPDILESDEDDSKLEQRVKNALIGAGFGGSLEALVRGVMLVGKLIKLRVSKDSAIFKEAVGGGSGDDIAEKLAKKPQGETGMPTKADDTPQTTGSQTADNVKVAKEQTEQPEQMNLFDNDKAGRIEAELDKPTYDPVKSLNDQLKKNIFDPDHKTSFMEGSQNMSAFTAKNIEDVGENISPTELFSRTQRSYRGQKGAIRLQADVDNFHVGLKPEYQNFLNKDFLKHAITKYSIYGVDLRKITPEAVSKYIDELFPRKLLISKKNVQEKMEAYLRVATDKRGLFVEEFDTLQNFQREYRNIFYKIGQVDVITKYGKLVHPDKIPKGQVEINRNVMRQIGQLKHASISYLADNAKTYLTALKASGDVDMFRQYADKIGNLIADTQNLEVMLKTPQSIQGTNLKYLDLNQYGYNPARITQDLLEGKNVPAIIDYNKLNKYILNPKYSNIEKTYKLLKNFHKFQLQPTLENGILTLKGVRGNTYFSKSMGALHDFFEMAGNVIVMNILSGISTKLLVTAGNTVATGIKLTEDIADDIFSGIYRGFRKVYSLGDSPAMVKESQALNRLYYLFGSLGLASKETFNFFRGVTDAKDLTYIDPRSLTTPMTFQTGSDSIYQTGRRKLKTWQVGADESNKMIWALSKTGDHFLNTLDMVHGYRGLQAMDIFTTQVTIPHEIRKAIIKHLNYEQTLRKKVGKKPLTEAELKTKVDALHAQAMDDAKNKVPNRFSTEAFEVVNRMTMKSPNVKIAGTQRLNIGDTISQVQKLVGKIPGAKGIITSFTRIFLNSKNWAVERLPLIQFASPDIRSAWGTGKKSEVLAKSAVGSLAGIGAYLLFNDKNKTVFWADKTYKKKNIHALLNRYPYAPLVIDGGNNQFYEIDTASPWGALVGFWIKFGSHIEDWKNPEEFATEVFGALFEATASTMSPLELLDRHKLLFEAFDEKENQGYISRKTAVNLVNAGILKEASSYLRNTSLQSPIGIRGTLHDDYEIQRAKYDAVWSKVFKRNVPFMQSSGDVGYPKVDFMGNTTTITSDPRGGFSPNDLTMGEKFQNSKAYQFFKRRYPVRDSLIVQELMSITDTGLTPSAEQNGFQSLYANPEISFKSIMGIKTFDELLKATLDNAENKQDAIAGYLTNNLINQKDLYYRLYNKGFILNDKGVYHINKLAGGKQIQSGKIVIDPRKEIDKYLSGSKNSEQFISNLLKNTELGDLATELSEASSYFPIFSKLGNNISDALTQILFNPSEHAVKTEWDRLLNEERKKGRIITDNIRDHLLLEAMQNKFKSIGLSDLEEGKVGLTISPDIIKIEDSLDGRYLLEKLKNPYLSAEDKEASNSKRREIVNKVASAYHGFAKYLYIHKILLKDPKFLDNVYDRVVDEMVEKSSPELIDRQGQPKMTGGIQIPQMGGGQ